MVYMRVAWSIKAAFNLEKGITVSRIAFGRPIKFVSDKNNLSRVLFEFIDLDVQPIQKGGRLRWFSIMNCRIMGRSGGVVYGISMHRCVVIRGNLYNFSAFGD
jgi:hypothetical protein